MNIFSSQWYSSLYQSWSQPLSWEFIIELMKLTGRRSLFLFFVFWLIRLLLRQQGICTVEQFIYSIGPVGPRVANLWHACQMWHATGFFWHATWYFKPGLLNHNQDRSSWKSSLFAKVQKNKIIAGLIPAKKIFQPVVWVIIGIPISASGLEFNFQAYQIGHI